MDRPAVGTVPGKRAVLSSDTWSPEVYARFAAERRRPFDDLLAMVAPIPGGRAVDLGCGTGELTRELHRRTGASETVGIDSSPAMLEKTKPLGGEGLRFEEGDLARFAPERGFDLVFSNAALHWAPDHPRLLERLTRAREPGGQLADGDRAAEELLERGDVPRAERRGRGGCGPVLPAAHPAAHAAEHLHQAQAHHGVLRGYRLLRHGPPQRLVPA